MKKYKEIESYGGNIESAVNTLLKYKKSGELVFLNFNGNKLYSDTVTLDSAYTEICGYTKTEFDARQKQRIAEIEKADREHEAKIPELTEYWIRKGSEILDKEYHEYWDEIVSVRLKDLYKGMELRCCLDIVKVLNEGGSYKQAEAVLSKQDHSGMSYSLVKAMVIEFCKRGTEFYEII